MMPTQLELKAKEIVSQLSKERIARWEVYFRKANARYEIGADCKGRTENCGRVDVRPPNRLGVVFHQSGVKITIRKEDSRIIQGLDLKEVERLKKGGLLPRIDDIRNNDFFSGLRTPRHIRDGCMAEVKATHGLIDAFNLVDVKFALETKPAEPEINDAIIKLDTFATEVLSKKRKALKRIMAMEKYEKARKKLLEVMDSRNPVFTMGTACAIFVAFLNRLGDWNTWDLAGICVHNFHRECLIRVKRDDWLRWQLTMLANDPVGAFNYLNYGTKVAKLDGVFDPVKILNESEKMPEEYLSGVIEKLREAVKLFSNFKVKFSGRHFKDTLKELDRATKKAA